MSEAKQRDKETVEHPLQAIVRTRVDFSQALLLMKEGKRVRRIGWANNKHPDNRKLTIELTQRHEFYVRYFRYNSTRGMIPAGDILADDWEEVT